jgi:hypothetical protein
MTSAFGKKEKGCCLHGEPLSGVRQTATLIAKRKSGKTATQSCRLPDS